jgi:hypothetical protein
MATEHSKDETSVGNKDGLSRLNGSSKGGVGAAELLSVSLVGVIGGEGDAFSLFEGDLLCTVGEESRSDFRSLCVKENT